MKVMKKEFIMPSMKVKVFDRTILLTDSNPTNSQAAENYAINNAGLTQSNDGNTVSLAQIEITDW